MRASPLVGNREPASGILFLAIILTLWCVPVRGLTQDSGRIPDPGSRFPAEPIRCWRQASTGAITIGETFSVVLTCAVFETEDAQAVPDESRLNVASIQMAPFEILGGSHPPDVRRGFRRFFQYSYQLRIISPDAIGKDVNVPPLTLSYRVHSRVGAAAKLEGRDLSYLLPAMPIRVLSLVPSDAGDIRDASDASLGAVDALRFRSRLFEMIALALGALAVVIAILALVPLARRSRGAEGPRRDRLADRAVLARAAEELTGVQAVVARDGWTDDVVARALGAMRLVAGVAIDREVSQRALAADGIVPEGRLLVRHGLIRPVTATVSSAVTADDVARAASRGSAPMSVTRGHQLEGLQHGLATMTTALYRQAPARDRAELDEAVRHAVSVAQEVAAERNWWRGLRQGFGAGGSRWARR